MLLISAAPATAKTFNTSGDHSHALTARVTVYAASRFAPAGAQGACEAPTQLATAMGTVTATIYTG
jgi:hypothetical protein